MTTVATTRYRPASGPPVPSHPRRWDTLVGTDLCSVFWPTITSRGGGASRCGATVPIHQSVSEQRLFTEEFHAKAIVGSALVISVVAFGVWMLGVWMGDLHTSLNAIHLFGNVVAIAGALGSCFSAWLAIRVWIARHRQSTWHHR